MSYREKAERIFPDLGQEDRYLQVIMIPGREFASLIETGRSIATIIFPEDQRPKVGQEIEVGRSGEVVHPGDIDGSGVDVIKAVVTQIFENNKYEVQLFNEEKKV